MKKDTLRAVTAAVVQLIAYHVVVFLAPFPKTTAVFWISYGFSLVAFLVMSAAIYIALIRRPGSKSKFYGFPIARIGVIYGAIQLVAGLVFMALGDIVPWWIAVLVFAVALAMAVIGLISAEAVVEHIHVQDQNLVKDVALMRSLQSKLNQMSAQCDDGKAEAAVNCFADELRYSDPVSSAVLEEIERDLAAVVDELQSAVADGDSAAVCKICSKASGILAERNRLCKLSKA